MSVNKATPYPVVVGGATATRRSATPVIQAAVISNDVHRRLKTKLKSKDSKA